MKIQPTKLTALVAVIAAVAGFGTSRSLAASYLDWDDFTPGGVSIAAGGTYSSVGLNNFNITDSNADADGDTIGYNPLTQYLISALASFTLFSDAGNVSSQVEVKVDSEQLNDLDFDTIFSIVFGDLSASGFITLNNSGILDYTIKNNGSGAIRLDLAILSAEYGDKLPGNNVPDAGSTAALLGTVSFAAWALRRRFGKIA